MVSSLSNQYSIFCVLRLFSVATEHLVVDTRSPALFAAWMGFSYRCDNVQAMFEVRTAARRLHGKKVAREEIARRLICIDMLVYVEISNFARNVIRYWW